MAGRWGRGRDVGLEIYNQTGEDGSVAFYGPSGYAVPFAKRRDGTFRNTLTGVDGRLTYSSAQSEYTLRFNYTGEKYVFDAYGILKRRLDENGNTITYTYDGNGKLTSITDTLGRVVTISYNAQNLISQISDWSNPVRSWSYTYWLTSSLLKTVTDPLGKVTQYEYDLSHRVTKIIDPRGNEVRLSYVMSGTTPSFEKLTVKYITNPSTGDGHSWLYEFCGTITSCPEGAPDNEADARTVLKDPNGFRSRWYYDRAGRVKTFKDALGKMRLLVFGANARINSYTNAGSKVTNYDYDDDQPQPDHKVRFTKLAAAVGQPRATWELRYENTSRPFDPTLAIDPAGNSVQYAYNNTTGNVESVTYAPGSGDAKTASYVYNSRGLPTSATDFKGNVTTYENDPTGLYGPVGAHLTKIIHPSPLGAETFTYDALSRLASATDGRGQKTEYAYDPLDRITLLTFRNAGGSIESTISYVYDDNGNVSTMTDNTGTTSYQYDTLDRLTKETPPGGLPFTSYTYDGVNLRSVTRATETVSYVYNDLNLLTSLTEPGGAVTTFAYDDDYNRKRTTFPAGASLVSTCAYYDEAERLTTIFSRPVSSCPVSAASDPSDINWFQYSYLSGALDTNRRQSVTEKAGDTTTYTYDPALGRLTQARNTASGGAQQWAYQYAYDANSNRCRMRQLTTQAVADPFTCSFSDQYTTSYTVNAADQLTQVGTTTYNYDANGNESSISGGGRIWAYNAKNQATSFDPPGFPATAMAYTGPGQFKRTSAGSASFDNDALGLSGEGPTAVYYTRTPDGEILGMRRSGTRYYYLLDGLGSVAAVVDQNGSTAATYSYEPFGKLRTSTGTLTNPYRWLGSLGVYWEGQARPGMDLYKMGTRWYDPALGRFTQVDPIPGGLNRYDYALQDPINSADVDGLSPGPTGGVYVLTDPVTGSVRYVGMSGKDVWRRAVQSRRLKSDQAGTRLKIVIRFRHSDLATIKGVEQRLYRYYKPDLNFRRPVGRGYWNRGATLMGARGFRVAALGGGILRFK